MGQGENEQLYLYLIWTYLFPNLQDCIIFQLIRLEASDRAHKTTRLFAQYSSFGYSMNGNASNDLVSEWVREYSGQLNIST